MSEIVIQRDVYLSVQDFVDVLRRSGLHERRPVDDLPRIAAMLDCANLILTARKDGQIIGVARSVTDFAYCCYCSDLAVDRDFQKQGIGKKLLEATKAALHREAKLFLISAPGAISYYEHIGMKRQERCFEMK
ncbi:MAG: GNAT family N-acetyltransferase [Alphaproteobacteria bacterium]